MSRPPPPLKDAQTRRDQEQFTSLLQSEAQMGRKPSVEPLDLENHLQAAEY